MALIAVSTDDPGIARIFFDLRAVGPTSDEESRIASAIERAFADQQAEQPPPAESVSAHRVEQAVADMRHIGRR